MFYIEFDNGETVIAKDEGWRLLDMVVPDVQTTIEKDSASGLPGSIYYGINVGDRGDIVLTFDASFKQLSEFASVRNQIYKQFNNGPGKLFMSWNPDEAEDNLFLRIAKKEIEVSRIGYKARAEVLLETIQLPYFETVVPKIKTYSNLATINHVNSGDILLDHRYTDTVYEITLNSVASFFQISVNGTTWRITKSLSSGDVIRIANGSASVNGEDVIDDITKNIVRLEPGNNRLEILGTMEYSMKIITKEYFY